ncbi:MAG: polymer-forming cytoskeletal protein [Acidobacteriota bacterium]
MGLFGDAKPQRPPQSSGTAPTMPSPMGLPPSQLKNPCTVLGPTLEVVGEMTSDEDVIIEGKFSGKLSCTSRITIGRTGVVEADLDADTIQISGKVRGNLNARHKIEIIASGFLEGNIRTPKVIVAEGAVFKGSVDMSPIAAAPAAKLEVPPQMVAVPAAAAQGPARAKK